VPGSHLLTYNQTNKEIIAQRTIVAVNFWTRLRGLMFTANLPVGTALWLKPCNGIHMFFMRYPLDIIFLDNNLTVVHIIENLQPWRLSPIIKKATSVLELPAGSITGKVNLGDRFSLSDRGRAKETFLLPCETGDGSLFSETGDGSLF
jgi:uncharacterized membrane protein (UPF0127 family)